mmetsp:Transcript_17238/g.34306  ORF Transcript_17238/g.34306 Transcript_17238/m.34306 type:complete len:603 (+) Transcript_17238:134-1942(+)|eukprot:CAMPEP_0194305860 /NCGR_PEP_ID=MMETSP0171-20130528/3191_1 /TAXON_ID=218684 /ORGANISM="Corethron pennatum, Strain L29A3" /LENGTH=602 /DNA_ID=CAMNT_0039057509 /DNA_START=80 /DNA_END=1888 /DNA_ORIENTATION=+
MTSLASDSPSRYLYILPVLFLEFLALSLTRPIIPYLLLAAYPTTLYLVMGCADAIRGLLSFVSGPLIGKLSDATGRRTCLVVTVLGTTAPVCALAVLDGSDTGNKRRMDTFVTMMALSGLLSATFTVAFAYISDVVKGEQARERRVAAYGMALATLGLSYSVGPMAGGYIGRSAIVTEAGANNGSGLFAGAASDLDATYEEKGEISSGGASELAGAATMYNADGEHRVFLLCFLLTAANLLYMMYVLPESRKVDPAVRRRRLVELCPPLRFLFPSSGAGESDSSDDISSASLEEYKNRSIVSPPSRQAAGESNFIAASRAFSPMDTIRLFSGDPFLAEIGRITFFYYMALWAVISTMLLYAAKRFEMGPGRLGELMSAFGLCTMLSEGVIVRVVVPSFGEQATLRFGLLAFAGQCLVIGLAWEGWMLFLCVGFSLASNLVYPSLTSMVSEAVSPEAVGEALGALNGVRALTEGISPLVFGFLMTMSESSSVPGWPYFIAASFAAIAYYRSTFLPQIENDYISEKHIGASTAERKDGRMHRVIGFFRSQENDQNVVLPKLDPEEEHRGLLDADDIYDQRGEDSGYDSESSSTYQVSYFQGEGI